MALPEAVPAQIHHLEVGVEPQYLSDAIRARACYLVPAEVKFLDTRVGLLTQLDQAVYSRISNLILRKIQSLQIRVHPLDHAFGQNLNLVIVNAILRQV